MDAPHIIDRFVRGRMAWIQTRPPVPTADHPFADILAKYGYQPRTRSGCEEEAKANPSYDVEACVRREYERNWNDVGRAIWVFLPPALILFFGVVDDQP